MSPNVLWILVKFQKLEIKVSDVRYKPVKSPTFSKMHDKRHLILYCGSEKRMSAFCPASLINYLVKEIGALCKLRPQGMLGPVYPEISSEGLSIEGEGRRGQHTDPGNVIGKDRQS